MSNSFKKWTALSHTNKIIEKLEIQIPIIIQSFLSVAYSDIFEQRKGIF